MISERWTNGRRIDGLTIQAGLDGYVIIPAKGLSIDRCPCCDEAFTYDAGGLRGARLVADMLWPLNHGAGAEP